MPKRDQLTEKSQ